MPIPADDVDLIDRLSNANIRLARDSARKALQRLVGEAAASGALGAGRFHAQIAEHYIEEYRACGNALWDATRDVLDASHTSAGAIDSDAVKQMLLSRLVALWQQLEIDLERDLSTHNSLHGLAGRLGDAHRTFCDELFARVDLYARQKTSRVDITIDAAMTSRDELTGIPDRRSLNAALSEEFATPPTRERPVSIVMIDVDKFKSVNDSHGHKKGDAVLTAIARRLSTGVKQKGEIFRYGGEEFAMVLPNSDVNEAVVTAERLRKSVDAAEIEGLRITISLGVAEAPLHALDAETLLHLADLALYDAKKRGRNLVRIHGELAPSDMGTREPERKVPSLGGFTESEANAIRRDYFTAGSTRCPRDAAILDVRESHELGNPTPHIFVWCKLCGISEMT